MLFPCGLTPANVQTCEPYCGTAALTSCYISCNDGVPGSTTDYPWLDTDGGTKPVVVQCTTLVATGRRPAGLVEESGSEARSVGDLLARQAHLEAASVDAFLDLAAELQAHGAPACLVERLRRAAAEEVRHAKVTGDLARARGGEPAAAKVEPVGKRTLLAIALENAREGCVRETWGAASAVAQSERARDAEIRSAMKSIARDELGHAALSWDLAAWLEARLSDDEKAAVAEERAMAVAELEGEIESVLPEVYRCTLGIPTRDEARAIFATMRAEVWEGV